MTLKAFLAYARLRPAYALALVVALAVWLGAWANRRPGEVAETVRIVRHAQMVYRDKPVLRDRFVDRIIYRTVRPETVTVSLPGEVDTLVQRFCEADTTKPLALVLTAGRVADRRLQLYGFRNDGSAYRGVWAVRPSYEFVAYGDSVAVSQARLRLRLPVLPVTVALVSFAAGWLVAH